jgi:hypothetical protein
MDIASTLSARTIIDSTTGSGQSLYVFHSTDKVHLAIILEDGTTSRIVVNKAELLAALK